MVSISIVIPVYNVEAYIERCVQSVMDQSYLGPMECIIIDDCGTDNSIRLIDKMLEGYHGTIDFDIVHHEKNRGLSAARNTGLELAKGEYVYFLDSDDAMSSDCLRMMAEEVERYPGLEMVMGAHEIVFSDSDEVRLSRKDACHIEDNRRIRFDFCKDEDPLNVVAWNRLVSMSFIKKNGFRFLEGVVHEDEHWSFYIFMNLTTLSIIDNVTYVHYVRPNSIVTSESDIDRAEAWRTILIHIVKSFNEPLKSLQVYKYVLCFLYMVFPYLSKKATRGLCFQFVVELLKMRRLTLAMYLFINCFHRFRFYRLSYQMIPYCYRCQAVCESESFSN